MGFWSKLGKIGKIAAPIAASFIPGVGPLLGAAIGGGIGGASKKLSGGSWKDALLSGGIGAGASYLGGKLPGIKGIGPSGKPTDYIGRDIANVAGKSGWQDKLGGVLSGISQSSSGNMRTPPFVQENQDGGWQEALGSLLGEITNRSTSNQSMNQSSNQPRVDPDRGYTSGQSSDPGLSRFGRQMRRQLGPVMGQSDQSSPNLALSIGQGRMDAISDQPFRRGYDVRSISDINEETGEPTYEYTQMPRIGPGRRRGNRGYNYQQAAE